MGAGGSSLLKRIKRRESRRAPSALSSNPNSATACPNEGLSASLDENIRAVRDEFKDTADLVVREIVLAQEPEQRVAVIYLASIADVQLIRESVIGPLVIDTGEHLPGLLDGSALIARLRVTIPAAREVCLVRSRGDVIDGLLEGDAILFADGSEEALHFEAKRVLARSIEKPTSEVTVLGPQVGFTESIRDNIALVRARIKSPDLMVERMVIGRKSKTDVRLMYMRGIAPEEIVREVRRRIQSIDTDVILDVGEIRDLIGERQYSPFVLDRLTERPDTAASSVNAGSVVILVDTSPFVMIEPSQFFMLFSAAEDYYMNDVATTVLRLVRMMAYVLSAIATPLYVGVVTFHHELIPLPLLLNIASTQEGVPFPLGLTALAAEIVLDVIREAGVRLPQQFGPTVSIVGALVLGQAAIQAGFVPPGLVIVSMLSTIASFAMPRSESVIAYRIVRFPLLFMASVLGLPGLTLGVVALIYHLASLKTFGVPFFTMYAPGRVQRLARKLILAPYELRPSDRPLGSRDKTWKGSPPKPRDPRGETDSQ